MPVVYGALGSVEMGDLIMARWLVGIGAAFVATLAFSSGGSAQDYPNRTVKIIVPFPAGGTADAIPRVIADWLSKKWGQGVVIENRAGEIGRAHV